MYCCVCATFFSCLCLLRRGLLSCPPSFLDPDAITLVAAASDAGSSSRGGRLLTGERDLHYLPFSHVTTHAVLLQCSWFSLQYFLYTRTQGGTSVFWSTVFRYGNIGELFMF